MDEPLLIEAAPQPTRAEKVPSVARLLVGGFVLLSLVETGNALIAPARVPTDADWASAAAEVRAGFQKDDLIVFAPAWADQVGRFHLGDLVTPAMAARPDADRYARIWEVSERGARSPETLADDAIPELLHKHGRLTVRLFHRTAPVVPLFDFVASLDAARATQTPGGEVWASPCRKDPAGGFDCSTTRVERRTLEINYAPHLGILVPVDGRLQTSLVWDDVPIGGGIAGHVGLSDYYARKNSDGLVEFKVYVNGQLALERRVKNDDHWPRFFVDTNRFRGRGGVRFEVSAPAAAWRNFGFSAEVRDSSEPPRG